MPTAEGELDLLEIPEALADRGLKTMELCHFHVPSLDPIYLRELRHSIESSGIQLWSLLIDDGDIVHPQNGSRDEAWIASWIEVAGQLDSRCVRVIGGKSMPSETAWDASASALGRLAKGARQFGIRVLTENWFETLSTPEAVEWLFSHTDESVGLCFDFGNWGGGSKYADLAQIVRFADSCHAKCQYAESRPDRLDFARCLEITAEADFSGPYTIVHGEPGRVWESIAEQAEMLEPFLGSVTGSVVEQNS